MSSTLIPANGKLEVSPLAAAAVASLLKDQFIVLQEYGFLGRMLETHLELLIKEADMAAQ